MQYDKSDAFLNAAFNVVRLVDRPTYRSMDAAEWRVTTDMFAWIHDISSQAGMPDTPPSFQILMMMMESEGNTISRHSLCATCAATTFINPDAIKTDAREDGVTDVYAYASAALVHEFQHIGQTADAMSDHAMGETDAFNAQLRYGLKVAGHDQVTGNAIMADARQGLRNVKTGNYPNVAPAYDLITRKDYREVAGILNTARNANITQSTISNDLIANLLADYFAMTNPRFDRKRFMDAVNAPPAVIVK